ncbi:MAG: tetratricopeptide repeat protein [Pseudomonadota bacterium]
MKKLFFVLGALIVMLSSCASPEERVAGFTKSGDALIEKGEPEKALLQYKNALQIDEGYLPALRGVVRGMEALESPGQIPSVLERIVELDKSDVASRVRLAKSLVLGGALLQAKDYIDQALEIEPRNANALAVSATVLLGLEDEAGAVSAAEKAIALDQSVTDAYAALAGEKLRNGDIEGAIEQLDRGIGKADELSLSLIKVQLYERLKDADSVVALFDRIISLSPEDEWLKRRYAYFLVAADRPAEAKRLFVELAESPASSDDAVIDLIKFENTINGPIAAEKLLQPFISEDPGRYPLRTFLANLKKAQNDTAGALKVLDSIAADAGQTPVGLEAKAQIADLYFTSGSRDKADGLVEEVLSQDARQASALVFRAKMAIVDGRLDDAISDLRTVLSDNPSSTSALTFLGQAHDLAGSGDLAEERYAEAFRASGGSVETGVTYAEFLLRRSNPNLAEEILATVLKQAPENLDAWRTLARARLQKADWIGAQEVADRIAELGGGDEFLGEIEGAALQGLNRFSESLDAFQRSHDAAPSSARPLVNLIRAYLATNRVADAIKFLESLTSRNPENTLASVLLAEAHSINDQPNLAEVVLQNARNENPDSTLIYQTLYRYYTSANRDDEAENLVDVASTRLPDNPTVLLLKADHLQRKLDFDAAISVYEQLAKLSPNSMMIANNLASLLSEHRNDPESLERARQIALRLRDSDVPEFKDTLGWIYFRTGDLPKGMDIIEDLVTDYPEIAIFRYHLGEIYLADGQLEAGQRELNKALSLSDQQTLISRDRIQEALDRS